MIISNKDLLKLFITDIEKCKSNIHFLQNIKEMYSKKI
jgi:hypothetical protein